jgi:NADPH:quinone reductase-like Zn-dependent oxidoreductase
MLLAPINPADLLVLAGRYRSASDTGTVIGAEGVGRIAMVGAGVTDLLPGDRVILLTRGNWCGWRIVHGNTALRVPDALPDDQAAMLRINPATAWRLLDQVALAPGEWLAQNAAGSSVAGWVRRIAQSRGIGIVDIVRADRGAKQAIVDGDDLVRCVAEATGGSTVRAALDAVAGEATGRLAACLVPGGRLAVYGHLSGQPCSIPSALLTAGQLMVFGFSLRPAEQSDLEGRRTALYAALATMMIASPEAVAAVHPISQLEAALGQARRCGRSGRILLALDC